MRKIIPLLLALLLALTACAPQENTAVSDGKTVIATIYPLYITAANITKGVEGIQVKQLLPVTAGCGHDYQLTTEDIRTVEGAELMLTILDGDFIPKLREAYPDLPILDTAVNIELIGHEDHMNEHIWLDPQAVIAQAKEIARYLGSIDEANAATYTSNMEAYVDKLEALDAELSEKLAEVEKTPVLAYHGTFAYFARRYNFDILEEIVHSEDEQPSSQHIAELITMIANNGVEHIWLESEDEQQSVQALIAETQAETVILHSITAGEADDLDAYLNGMRENAEALAAAARG